MKPLSREKITTTIQGIIAEQLGMDDSEVTVASLLWEDLGADSLDMVEIQISMEDEFGIEIPDEDVADHWKCMFNTVTDVIDYIERRLKS